MAQSFFLGGAPRRKWLTVVQITGERSFRRRLLEMGLLPGTRVRVTGIAPLRDPMTLETENGRISIRRREANEIQVKG